jgi:CubicO group peptidase (beta-lactamase class C family)
MRSSLTELTLRRMRRIALSAVSLVVLAGAARADAVSPADLMKGFPPAPEATVSAANWRTPPFNTWAFQHIEQVIPTRTTFRGYGPVMPLPEAGRRTVEHYRKAMQSGGFDLPGFMSANHVDGLLVLKDGRKVDERYANGQEPSSRHAMMSVGKSVVGTIAELLIHEGRLDEHQRVAHYVPELAASAYGDATVRQVLDMLIGVDYSEAMDDPASDVNQFLYAARLGTPPPGVTPKASLYDYVRGLRKKGEHGEVFHYVTPTSEVLGWIIARATGSSWADLFESRIFQPLGPERDGFVIVDAVGTQTAAGGLALTLRDAGRFGLMIANDGKFGGRQVLPTEVVRRIKAGGDPSRWPPQEWAKGVHSYGSQWWIDHTARTLTAYGIHGQLIRIGLDDGIVVVVQSSWPAAGGPDFLARQLSFYDAVRAALR